MDPIQCNELVAQTQLISTCLEAMKIDFPTLPTIRTEREWDSFFRRLEERFMMIGIEHNDYLRQMILRRLLRNPHLSRWVAICAEEKDYSRARDRLYREFFPHSDLYASLLKILQPVAPSAVPSQGQDGPATTPTTAATPANQEQGGNTTAGSETASEVSPSGQAKKQPLCSLSTIRSRANTLKENLSRVSARYDSPMPSEETWINWAVSLMRPSLLEAYNGLPTKPTSLNDLFVVVLEPENNASGERRAPSSRRFRRKGQGQTSRVRAPTSTSEGGPTPTASSPQTTTTTPAAGSPVTAAPVMTATAEA